MSVSAQISQKSGSALPEAVAGLVARFRANRAQYLAADYNEANVRVEFIDPLLESLGWDVQNKSGAAEQYKPVKVEDSLRVAGKASAPDYSLRIGGARKILVEAKKPGVNLKSNADAARQLRRYAWSAQAPVGILTDFEEFAVYDCRERPRATHSAAHARIRYFTCEEYGAQWEWLAGHFSPDAIMRGNLDRLAADLGARRGAESVGDAFLEQMEKFRDILAHEVALRNPDLSERELNHAARRTLDRIVFLRVCEDRGVENYGRLRDAVRREGAYGELMKLFHAADRRYNSGLFYLTPEKGRGKPDELSPKLNIGGRPLRDIVDALYLPESPYDFSVIGADILGQAYERFLGKEIRLTAGHHARVEEKPEVRKQGGVFYTPGWVVRHIVNRALGDALRGEAPARNLRVLDPACGSGSFLLGAYEFLLDRRLEKHCENPRRNLDDGRIVKNDRGEYRLSLAERREILTSNLWGVDKDEQAVEVAKLSLMMKCLEGENSGSIGAARHALPDLNRNIRCGNSIVGPDIYGDSPLPDDREILRVNPFDWERAFPQIIRDEGGFDAVVGNPPYVRQEILGRDFKEYAEKRYAVYHGTADLFSYFIERGLSLLKPGGRFSYIVANKWMRAKYGEPLRKFLRGRELLEVVDFGVLQVFPGATTYTCILTAGGGTAGESFEVAKMERLPGTGDDFSEMVRARKRKLPHSSLGDSGWSLARADASGLLEKLKRENIPLTDFVGGEIYRGVVTGCNKAFVIGDAEREGLIQQDPKSAELIRPFVVGRDVKRYAPLPDGKWLIFARRGVNIADYPAIREHLERHRKQLRPRPENWSGEKKWPGRKPGRYKWFELQDPVEYHAVFGKAKIVYPNISAAPNFTLDSDGILTNQKCFVIPTDDKCLLAILNSPLCMFFFKNVLPELRGGFYEPSLVHFKNFPVPPVREDGSNAELRRELGELAGAAMRETRAMAETSDSHIREARERLLAEINAKIDERVFALYNLTNAERRIITS